MAYTTKALRYGSQDAAKKCGLRPKDICAYVDRETEGRIYARVIIVYKDHDREIDIRISELDVWDRAKVCELVCEEIKRPCFVALRNQK